MKKVAYMAISRWQLLSPINAVIFDCDGTLSAIEGIDELAKNKGVEKLVNRLTAEAMGKTGLNPALYQKRLDLVQPHKDEVLALGQHYFNHRIANVISVIQILQRLNKKVYIISAGLYPAVAIFGDMLQVPRENIFAVNIQFDLQGNYFSFDRESPLVNLGGKRVIVSQLKALHPDILYIGDALNDYEIYDLATRFVGFGGAFYRENIASRCQYYITASSMDPLLPLALTQVEYDSLTSVEQALYHHGLTTIYEGEVIIR